MLASRSPYLDTQQLDSLTDIKDLSNTTPIRKIRINNTPKFLMDKLFAQKNRRNSTKKKSEGTNSYGFRQTASLNTNEVDEKLSKITQQRRARFSSFKQASPQKATNYKKSVHISKFQQEIVEEIIKEVDSPNSKEEKIINKNYLNFTKKKRLELSDLTSL